MLVIYLRSLVDCTLHDMHFPPSCVSSYAHHPREGFAFEGELSFALVLHFFLAYFQEECLCSGGACELFMLLLLSCIRLVGACDFYAFVSVVLSHCPCLWGPRLLQVDLAFVMYLMQVTLILAFMWLLFTCIRVLLGS